MTRRVMLTCIAVVAILGMALVGIAPVSASPRFTVTVNHTTLVSGRALTVTGTSNVTCEWAIRWAGQTRVKRNTKVISARFVAPRVTKPRKYRLVALCNYRGTAPPLTTVPKPVGSTHHRASASVEAVVPPHWLKTIIVTVVPRPRAVTKPSGTTLLPDTGGPRGWLFVAAFGLLLTGTGVLRLARRRVAVS